MDKRKKLISENRNKRLSVYLNKVIQKNGRENIIRRNKEKCFDVEIKKTTLQTKKA